MNWKPWDDCDIKKNVTEPPCKHCKFFNPKIMYHPARGGGSIHMAKRYHDFAVDDGYFDGVNICEADEMFNDFSCFRDGMASEKQDERT